VIRKLLSRNNQLYVPAGHISQVELDLMLDDMRKLYDTFKIIGHINLTRQDTLTKPEVMVNSAIPADPQPAASSTTTPYNKEHFYTSEPVYAPTLTEPEIEPVAEKGLENVPAQESKPKSEPEIISTSKTETQLTSENESSHEPAIETQAEPQSEFQEEETSDIETSESIQPVNPEHTPAMLADKFNTSNKSLSETMASTQPQGFMGSRIQFQPIANLITGIGLNDKFSFISDLFANNTAQYEEAIHRINKAVNIDEANWILQKYHSAEWETKHETLARLKDFVKRRFI